ncbi:MAG: biotin carboxylase N-terminal domain-containing protein [Micromonosporaceae bacterium]|jgi:acetyl-CoA carboxylase biotin carboxylase subunit
MIESLLIANRGEIARRIIRTARRLGIRTVAVHSEADAELPFVAEADEAVPLTGGNPAQVYRDAAALLAAARASGAQAVHPGYGFLSEDPDFARQVADAGLLWVGPEPETISAMGNKINARNLVAAAGVPVAPGTGEPVPDVDAARAEARRIGYPVMVKAAAGGGGMGMAVATDEESLATEYERVRGFAQRLFGNDAVLLERHFPRVRHVEAQILGLPDGTVVALGERECSVQRRHQKVAEEAPSPALTPQQRTALLAAAVRAGEAVGYRNAGTVEFLFDPDTGEFYFLEMNTRLQVEHPVTEAIFGIDLVEAQLRVAAGQPVEVPAEPVGHAVELRVNAEDPKRFLPGPGKVSTWVEPTGPGVRVDAGYAAGTTVTPYYDSLMAKLVVHGADRSEALARAREAVGAFEIAGPKHNLPFHAELLEHPEFVAGEYDTGIVARMR